MRQTLGTCLCLLGLLSPQASPIADRLLPSTALQAAEAGALPLGFLLARFGVPTGIVTTDNPSDPDIFKRNVSAPPSVRLADVLARFTATHPGDAVTMDGARLTIERKDVICSRRIDAMTLKPTTVDGDLGKLLVLLSWVASGDPPPVPGGTMSFIRTNAGDPPAPALPAIHFASTPGTTLRQAFDGAVLENKGGVWIVWQHTLPDGRTACRSAGY